MADFGLTRALDSGKNYAIVRVKNIKLAIKYAYLAFIMLSLFRACVFLSLRIQGCNRLFATHGGEGGGGGGGN